MGVYVPRNYRRRHGRPVREAWARMPPAVPIPETHRGVPYTTLKPQGCKAIIGGKGFDGLPFVCGLPRCPHPFLDRHAPYCRAHFEQYVSAAWLSREVTAQWQSQLSLSRTT